MVHVPLHASDAFRDRSANGRYGDAVEEVDWSTGQILDALRTLGIADRTIVIFTSDNGASLRGRGSNGPLSGGKGSTMEGGMRVPCLMWGPGRIPAGTECSDMAITMDLLPTFAGLAGAELPQDRTIDGRDIRPLMTGQPGARTPHEAFYYYHRQHLRAVRSGRWKLHVGIRQRLIDLVADVGETTDVAAEHPAVVARLLALAERARRDLGDGGTEGAGQRPAGMVVSPVPLLLPGAVYEPPVTRVALTHGESLPRDRVPPVGRRPLRVDLEIEHDGSDGVLLAHGGLAVGYVVLVRNGTLEFSVRRTRDSVVTARADAPLASGDHSIRATLGRGGRMLVHLNDHVVARANAGGLLPSVPAEPLDIARDTAKAIGDQYRSPFPYGGRVAAATISVD